MKRRSWLTGLFLIILSSVAIIIRVYFVDRLMAEVNISEDIYNAAKVSIGANGLTSAFAGGFRVQSLYICNLYFAFLIFGNFTVAGVYLNILYQVLTVIIIYIVIMGITNRYIAFAGGFIVAVLPGYINMLSEVTIQNMEIFIAALIGMIVISIVRLISQKHKVKKDTSEIKEEHAEIDVSDFLTDTSMKEILYDDLDDNKVQFIENPLPVPKRREHKEMDYAFEPTGSDDDYDVKDMTDKDYYDIE